jgi:hypothetical protein
MGIAGGRTIASVMKLMPRSEKLRGCTFFPLLRPTAQFLDAAVSSAAVISDALFRFGDLGVRMPDDIDKKDVIDAWVNVADVLLFTLGGAQRSSIARLLRRIRRSAAPDEREKIKSLLAGDILFNIYTKSGFTLEEIAGGGVTASAEERALAGEIIGTKDEPDPAVNGHAKFAACRRDYARYIADARLDLDLLRRHTRRSNRRTIIIAAGIDKLNIMQTFRKRVCEPEMRFTLITDQSLARALVAEMQGEAF